MVVCEHCKVKKVPVMPFTCNCGYKNLCIKCRLPSEHACTYNWRKVGMEQITKENPVIKANQIDPL
jgi:hypothetical protein